MIDIETTRVHLKNLVANLQHLNENRVVHKAYAAILEDSMDLPYKATREEIQVALQQNATKSLRWSIDIGHEAIRLTDQGHQFLIANVQPYIAEKIREMEVYPENSDNIKCLGSYKLACNDGFIYEVGAYYDEIQIRRGSFNDVVTNFADQLARSMVCFSSYMKQSEKMMIGQSDAPAYLGLPCDLIPGFLLNVISVTPSQGSVTLWLSDLVLSEISGDSINAAIRFKYDGTNFRLDELWPWWLDTLDAKNI